MVAAGAILGNLFQIFEVNLPGRMIFLAIYGLFGGIFVGCWAMALAEILNVFPIFMRRARIVRYLAVFVVMVALGKGIGAGLFFWKRW
jgi:stage V sporulation protein AB